MVWRSLTLLPIAVVSIFLVGCEAERDMVERFEMPDTMDVIRAMESGAARDSLLDVMPGGEMARGDSAASMELLDRMR